MAGRCSCGARDCGSPGKHPRGCYGLNHASTDLERVACWWHAQPEANVGLRCDGLLVVDVDGLDGERSLELLESELGDLPPTREQRSGRGRHLLYAAPTLSNSTAGLGRPPGLDLRSGPRGYVVAAPSRHVSGTRYRLANERQPELLPLRWLERLQRRKPPRPRLPDGGTGSSAYGKAALQDELERLLRARVGERNECLNESVFRLAQLVGGGSLGRDELEREAGVVASLLGLSPHESGMTIRSALRAGLAHPRWPADER